MQWLIEVFSDSFRQILNVNPYLIEVTKMTLQVSLSALAIATVIALPFAAFLATTEHKLKIIPITIINALMGLPPILVGLIVYLLLSRRGPFGFLDLLFTPTAMITAQVILIFPIVCGLSQVIFHQKWLLFKDLFMSLQISKLNSIKTIIYESRFQIINALATGLGRGLAEVGAVMIVGGNIMHHTRTITTTIALETSKGEISIAISLGIIMLLISLILNIILVCINLLQKNNYAH